ncbi:MAG: YigZ family protein [Bacteroidales bacterium]|nr:YigZ family protein [Bacteroidales bacterium]
MLIRLWTRDLFRMNDDGEPSGTAGKPIYGQILSHQLINVLIVVVRYFGGTKLGVRGLINAYKYAAASALENAVIKEKQLKHVYRLHYQYPLMNKVMYILKEENIEPISTAFKTDCKLTFAVRKNQSEKVYNRFKQMYPLEIKFLKAI